MAELTWKYVKPYLAENPTADLAASDGFVYPADFYAFAQTHNNARPVPNTVDTDKTKGRVLFSLLNLNPGTPDNIYDSRPTDTKQSFYPFARDPFGNYFVFSGEKKQVRFWEHETDRLEYISDTFTEMLKKLYENA